MILFTSPDFEPMAEALRERAPELHRGRYKVGRFDNGELRIEIETPVEGEPCAVLGSIAPPDERFLSALLLGDTLRKEGAYGISAVLPYLAYSRQDKDKPGQSLAAAWTGALLKASGFDCAITVDVHSAEDGRLFPIPLHSLSAERVFADALKQHRLTQATIIAPDEGAIGRCEAIRNAAGMADVPIAWFEKQRTDAGIVHSRFIGQVGLQAVLVDDILDTGATLLSACGRLLCAGVEDIQIMVTHGLFTGTEWQGLWNLGVSRIFCTDTVPLPTGIETKRIVVLPVAAVLAEALTNINEAVRAGC